MNEITPESTPDSKDLIMHTHRTDALSLVAGTLFLVIGLIATIGSVTFDDLSGQWVAPTLLGAAGLALIASVPMRRVHDEAGDEVHVEAGDGSIDQQSTSTDVNEVDDHV